MIRYTLIIFLLIIIIFSTSHLDAERYHNSRRKDTIKVRNETVGQKQVIEKAPIVRPVVLTIPIGPKKLIAVAEFENKTNISGQANLGVGMADQLITALMNTSRFIVLERQSMGVILKEQDFGVSSRTTEEGGAGIGKLSRAQILVQGAITEFSMNSSDSGGGVNVKGFTILTSKAEAHVAVDIRVYDITTGQILASKTCSGSAKTTSGGIGFKTDNWSFATGGKAKTPLDTALRQAIEQAVNFVVLELDKIPWEGRVAMVKNNIVYINYGRTGGVNLGDQFSVYKEGESIIDPETGLMLGSEKTLFGKVEIINVDEKFSKAVPVSGLGFERNDIIKYEKKIPIEGISAKLVQQ